MQTWFKRCERCARGPQKVAAAMKPRHNADESVEEAQQRRECIVRLQWAEAEEEPRATSSAQWGER